MYASLLADPYFHPSLLSYELIFYVSLQRLHNLKNLQAKKKKNVFYNFLVTEVTFYIKNMCFCPGIECNIPVFLRLQNLISESVSSPFLIYRLLEI